MTDLGLVMGLYCSGCPLSLSSIFLFVGLSADSDPWDMACQLQYICLQVT